jgi:2'-5' RNA ligase
MNKRIFIGLFPQVDDLAKNRAKIEKVENELHDYPIKWVKSDNWHFTLAFLGWYRIEDILDLENLLGEIKARVFSLKLESLGVFPYLKNPRVIWIGIKDKKALEGLAEKVKIKLLDQKINFDQKEFRPHLTIGRVKNRIKDQRFNQIIQSFNTTDFGTLEFINFVLVESKLTPSGPEYSILRSYRLSK